MLADGAPLPAEARAISYAAFWFLQLVISSGTSAGTRLLVLGRAAVLAVGMYVGWSWNAGDGGVCPLVSYSAQPDCLLTVYQCTRKHWS